MTRIEPPGANQKVFGKEKEREIHEIVTFFERKKRSDLYDWHCAGEGCEYAVTSAL